MLAGAKNFGKKFSCDVIQPSESNEYAHNRRRSAAVKWMVSTYISCARTLFYFKIRFRTWSFGTFFGTCRFQFLPTYVRTLTVVDKRRKGMIAPINKFWNGVLLYVTSVLLQTNSWRHNRMRFTYESSARPKRRTTTTDNWQHSSLLMYHQNRTGHRPTNIPKLKWVVS